LCHRTVTHMIFSWNLFGVNVEIFVNGNALDKVVRDKGALPFL